MAETSVVAPVQGQQTVANAPTANPNTGAGVDINPSGVLEDAARAQQRDPRILSAINSAFDSANSAIDACDLNAASQALSKIERALEGAIEPRHKSFIQIDATWAQRITPEEFAEAADKLTAQAYQLAVSASQKSDPLTALRALSAAEHAQLLTNGDSLVGTSQGDPSLRAYELAPELLRKMSPEEIKEAVRREVQALAQRAAKTGDANLLATAKDIAKNFGIELPELQAKAEGVDGPEADPEQDVKVEIERYPIVVTIDPNCGIPLGILKHIAPEMTRIKEEQPQEETDTEQALPEGEALPGATTGQERTTEVDGGQPAATTEEAGIEGEATVTTAPSSGTGPASAQAGVMEIAGPAGAVATVGAPAGFGPGIGASKAGALGWILNQLRPLGGGALDALVPFRRTSLLTGIETAKFALGSRLSDFNSEAIALSTDNSYKQYLAQLYNEQLSMYAQRLEGYAVWKAEDGAWIDRRNAWGAGNKAGRMGVRGFMPGDLGPGNRPITTHREAMNGQINDWDPNLLHQLGLSNGFDENSVTLRQDVAGKASFANPGGPLTQRIAEMDMGISPLLGHRSRQFYQDFRFTIPDAIGEAFAHQLAFPRGQSQWLDGQWGAGAVHDVSQWGSNLPHAFSQWGSNVWNSNGVGDFFSNLANFPLNFLHPYGNSLLFGGPAYNAGGQNVSIYGDSFPSLTGGPTP